MPLIKGDTKEAKASNYKKLREEGYPPKQQVAIMLSEAGESNQSKKSKNPKPKSK